MKIKLDILTFTATDPPAEIEPMIRALCRTLQIVCSPVPDDGFYVVKGKQARVEVVCRVINLLTDTHGTEFEIIERGE